MKRFSVRSTVPSPAMVVASLALFGALGGVGYAAATGSIDGREIKDNSVGSADVRNGALQGRDAGGNAFGGRAVNEQQGKQRRRHSRQGVSARQGADGRTSRHRRTGRHRRFGERGEHP